MLLESRFILCKMLVRNVDFTAGFVPTDLLACSYGPEAPGVFHGPFLNQLALPCGHSVDVTVIFTAAVAGVQDRFRQCILGQQHGVKCDSSYVSAFV